LTCWPPGPPDAEKRQVSSDHGTRTPGATANAGVGGASSGLGTG
jgi:hypothetical protein